MDWTVKSFPTQMYHGHFIRSEWKLVPTTSNLPDVLWIDYFRTYPVSVRRSDLLFSKSCWKLQLDLNFNSLLTKTPNFNAAFHIYNFFRIIRAYSCQAQTGWKIFFLCRNNGLFPTQCQLFTIFGHFAKYLYVHENECELGSWDSHENS